MTFPLPFARCLSSSNPYFAKTTMDCIFVSIFFCGVHLAVWYEVFHVLPQYEFESLHTVIFHCAMAAAFYVGTLSNLYKLITTRSDSNLAVLSGRESREWPYCSTCCLYKPPRSHHCKICNVCILSRDHHCWFSGCCIGHANHRYYLSLLLYVFAAATYANLFHRQFVVERLWHLGWALPICFLAPHVGAVLGFLTLYEFLVTVMTFLAFFCLVMFLWLLKIQIRQLLTGQLQYEHKKGIKNYNCGFLGNLTAVMGQQWYAAWVWPWIPSPLPGNGIAFPTPKIKSK